MVNENKVIVVLDDDPTGIQTVHGVHVYMDWTGETLRNAFENHNLFFIQTNTRSFSVKEAVRINREILHNLLTASRSTGRDFTVISRGDSTLRGHYPEETDTLRICYELETGKKYDGEILVPFFYEGGRVTVDDIHYLKENGLKTPVGNTEFAKDSTFGFKSSNLKEYIQEKTEGKVRAEDVISIPLELIRDKKTEEIVDRLMRITDYRRVIVNMENDQDLCGFVEALKIAEGQGKRFMFRTAASFVRVYGGITQKELMGKEELSKYIDNKNPGIIVVGSHVQKTTKQLNALLCERGLVPVEVDAKRVIESNECRTKEICAKILEIEKIMSEGKTPVLYTSRTVLRSCNGPSEDNLSISVSISSTLVEIIAKVKKKPAYVIAKGGITSSDIAVKAMEVKKAAVLGQVLPGIPVVLCGSESKWPGIPYVIFPGNVGDENALAETYKKFTLEENVEDEHGKIK